eukprot:2762269-Lingulodinium_polyedra.AAC.1
MAKTWPHRGQVIRNSRPIHQHSTAMERPSNERRTSNAPNGQRPTEPTRSNPAFHIASFRVASRNVAPRR